MVLLKAGQLSSAASVRTLGGIPECIVTQTPVPIRHYTRVFELPCLLQKNKEVKKLECFYCNSLWFCYNLWPIIPMLYMTLPLPVMTGVIILTHFIMFDFKVNDDGFGIESRNFPKLGRYYKHQ
jgi:hypothetical protein